MSRASRSYSVAAPRYFVYEASSCQWQMAKENRAHPEKKSKQTLTSRSTSSTSIGVPSRIMSLTLLKAVKVEYHKDDQEQI